MNPSSSSSNKHESNRRNSVSHSSTSSGTTNLSCNISNNGNKNNNITANHDDNNHSNSKNNNLNEHDLLSIAEEHCRSVLGQSNYPSSSWPSFKRMMSNLDHLDSINNTTIANTTTVSITTTTTTTTIISTTGVSLVPSSIPLTSTSTVNHFIEHSNHNYNELQNSGDSLKNGSLLSLSPSSSTSPSSGIKSHIKYKTDSRPQYLNSQSRPFHHYPPPPPPPHHPAQSSISQNNCFNNNNVGMSGSNNNIANGVVLLSGRADSILPSSTSNGANHGSDYLLIDPSRNITKRRKTIPSEIDVNLEISDNSITSSKLTPINSVHIHDDDDDVDDEGCDHDDIDDVNDNVEDVENGNSTSGSNGNEHLNQRYSHRHQQQYHHPVHQAVHHRHQQQNRRNADLTSLNEENIHNVIGSVNNDLDISNSCRSNNNNNNRYEKLVDNGKIHNISVDNFSFINQSRHLSNQINLPNDNEHNININNNNENCSTVLEQLQFRK